MACTATALIAAAMGDNLEGLSERDALNCLAWVYGHGTYATASANLNAAYASGLAKLSEEDLWRGILAVLC